MKKNWQTFIASIFFVLGFTIVFSLIGVLLQTTLLSISLEVQQWLSWIGGGLIIIFGLYLTGLFQLPFFEREHKFNIKPFKSGYLTAFIFGAAFAVGWTPCIGIILGGILSLAITKPTMAFILLFAYSLGLGIPFLLLGLFTSQLEKYIHKIGKPLKILRIIFGILLILIGILVFLNQLGSIASFNISASFLPLLEENLLGNTNLNIGIAFVAGIISFLSPCIIPLLPSYLTFLAAMMVKE